jgi:hypothetical protein
MSTAALPNPYPQGSRFAHNCTRKDINQIPTTPALSAEEANNSRLVAAGLPPTAPVAAQSYSTVYITDEARHIARHLGIRASAALVQRVLNAESAVAALAARVEQLEKQNRAPHLSKVEKRSA